jgi:gamma-glutamyltranspeptidase
MNILDAVRAPRVHSQLLPDSVEIEDQTLVSGLQITMPAFIVQGLAERGHHNATLVNIGMGVTQFIVCDPDSGLIEAVSDPRKDGKPAAEK